MQLGIDPYMIYDSEAKVAYLPDLNMLENITNTDYQKYIEEEVIMSGDQRYNVILMNGVKLSKVKTMNLGTYKLNSLKLDRGTVDVDAYSQYFITEDEK
jgi:hypothetical protein